MRKIREFLYLGDLCDANNWNNVLVTYNIFNILNVGCGKVRYKPNKLLHIQHSDFGPFIKMGICHDFINESISKQENILVHCVAGVNRSVAMISSYLIEYCDERTMEFLKNIPETDMEGYYWRYLKNMIDEKNREEVFGSEF